MPSVNDSPVSLLIVDPDPAKLAALSQALSKPDLQVVTAADAGNALEIVRRDCPRVVLTSQDTVALDTLARIVELAPSTQVLRTALGFNCCGDVSESDELPQLREMVGRALEESQRVHHWGLDEESRPDPEFGGVVGRSPLMCELFARIRRIAPYYRAALITGETGTGKDLVAHALHRLSTVSKGRYVVLNCSAIVETLFESELFGHVKGSFTGATHDKPGLFEHADGGTLFLDEIGDMPLATQAKLLRVLQNQEVQRVGSLTARKVNVRVIAATNGDMSRLIAQKRFREDLYYRLSMVELHVPRLADRRVDLPLLERHFLKRFAAEYGKQMYGMTHAAYTRLSEHPWPGNVRELENVIGHAAMMAAGEMIELSDLPSYLQAGDRHSAAYSLRTGTLREQERQLLIRALETAGGNQSKAARMLQIGRDALRYKLRKHNLEIPEPERTLAAAM